MSRHRNIQRRINRHANRSPASVSSPHDRNSLLAQTRKVGFASHQRLVAVAHLLDSVALIFIARLFAHFSWTFHQHLVANDDRTFLTFREKVAIVAFRWDWAPPVLPHFVV